MGPLIPTLPGSQIQWKRGVRALKRTTGKARGHYGLEECPLRSLKTSGWGKSSERKGQAARCSPLGEMNWACRAAGRRMRQEAGRALHPQSRPHCASEVTLGPGATNPCVDRSWEPLCRGQIQVLNQVVILLSPSLGGHPAGSQEGSLAQRVAGKGAASQGWALQERQGDWY